MAYESRIRTRPAIRRGGGRGTDRFLIEYDGHTGGPFGDGRFRQTASVTKTGTGEFKTVVFELVKVYFGNRDNGGDFRIADDSDGEECICKVTGRMLQ